MKNVFTTMFEVVIGLPWRYLPLLIIVTVVIGSHFWPDPQNERVAAGLVNSAYRVACTSATQEQYDHHDWEKVEQQYGRVRTWRVLAQRSTFESHQWDFDVEVTRERAVTQERIEVDAGPSKLYGYYTYVQFEYVESAHP